MWSFIARSYEYICRALTAPSMVFSGGEESGGGPPQHKVWVRRYRTLQSSLTPSWPVARSYFLAIDSLDIDERRTRFVCAPFVKLLRVFPVRFDCAAWREEKQQEREGERECSERRKNYRRDHNVVEKPRERADERRRLTPSSNSTGRKNYGKTLYHYTYGAVCERSGAAK